MLAPGFEGGMTARKHQRIAQTSTPTAARELVELERLGQWHVTIVGASL